MANWSAVRAGMGMVGTAGVAGLFFAALWLWTEDAQLAPNLDPDVVATLSTAGGLVVVSFIFYVVFFSLVIKQEGKTDKNTWALYTAGYPAQAAVFIGSFGFGMVSRVDGNNDPTFIVPGLLLGALVLLALIMSIVSHEPQKPGMDQKTEMSTGKFVFVSFQTLFSLASTVLLIFVFTHGGLHPDETIPYVCTMVSLFGQLIAFAIFYIYFRYKRNREDVIQTANASWVWCAIFVDVASVGLTAVAAGYFYPLGVEASQKAENPELVLWLLFAAGVTKCAQWVSSHSWSSVDNKKPHDD